MWQEAGSSSDLTSSSLGHTTQPLQVSTYEYTRTRMGTHNFTALMDNPWWSKLLSQSLYKTAIKYLLGSRPKSCLFCVPKSIQGFAFNFLRYLYCFSDMWGFLSPLAVSMVLSFDIKSLWLEWGVLRFPFVSLVTDDAVPYTSRPCLL